MLYLSSPTAEATQLFHNKIVYFSFNKKIPTDSHKYDVNTGCSETIIDCQAIHNQRSGPKNGEGLPWICYNLQNLLGNTQVAASSDMKVWS